MAYTINVTTNVTSATITPSPGYNVTVTAPATPTFTITNQVSNVGVITYLSTISMFSNAVELKVDDFDNYFKGDWISNQPYYRGDIVNYEYSLYTCNTGTLTTLVSVIPPPQDQGSTLPVDSVGNYADGNWRRVVWNEAPRDHLTITNYLNVGTIAGHGGLSIAGTSTFLGTMTINAPLIVNGTSTFNATATFHQALVLTDSLYVPRIYSKNIFNTGTIKTLELTVDDNSVLNGVTINGIADFENTVDFHKDVTVHYPSILQIGPTIGSESFPRPDGPSIQINRQGSIQFPDLCGSTFYIGEGNTVITRSVWNQEQALNVTNGILSATSGAILHYDSPGGPTNRHVIINDVIYPESKPASLGSVLYCSQPNAGYGPATAAWGPLGNLILWDLSSDLLTNGHNIYGNNNTLIISGGTPGDHYPNITFGGGIYINASPWISGILQIGSDGSVSAPVNLGVMGDFTGLNLDGGGGYQSNVGIKFSDGSFQTRAYTGGGGGGSVNSVSGSDYISVSTNTGDIIVYNTGVTEIYAGSGISVSGHTGNITISATGGGSGGGITEIYANQPLTSSVSGNTATIGLSFGYGLAVNGYGELYVNTGSYTNLTQDLITNAYYIRDVDGSGQNIQVAHDRVQINSPTEIILNAPRVKITYPPGGPGDPILGVNFITNEFFTGPPEFSAGVQFGDSTVQLTAWHGYDQGELII
jgi:hypothetical protein